MPPGLLAVYPSPKYAAYFPGLRPLGAGHTYEKKREESVYLPLVYSSDPYWIPYGRGIVAAGPFVDLSVFPGELDALPEVSEMPALRPILDLLNQPTTPYLTIGSGTRRHPPGDGGAEAQVDCYVEFAHRDREMGDPAWLYNLFHAFARRTTQVVLPPGLGIEFVMRPLVWQEEKSVGCWALGYQVRAVAPTIEGANALAITGLEGFRDFLVRFLRGG